MRRKTLRNIRIIVVGLMVFLMTFDQATAFHLFGGRFRSGGSYCGPSHSHSWGGASYSGRLRWLRRIQQRLRWRWLWWLERLWRWLRQY